MVDVSEWHLQQHHKYVFALTFFLSCLRCISSSGFDFPALLSGTDFVTERGMFLQTVLSTAHQRGGQSHTSLLLSQWGLIAVKNKLVSRVQEH